MLKHLLLVMLAVCVLGLAGCPELKNLRKQNSSLQDSLSRATQERDSYLSEITALQTERDSLKTQLAQSRTDAAASSDLVKQLKAEQARLDKQRQDLQTLLRGVAGVNIEGRSEGNFIVMDNDILFALGKVDLNPDAKNSLDKVAQYLAGNPNLSIRIDGHTDGVPIRVSDWEDNYQLGAMRAHSVMKYLGSKGVGSQRMFIAGFGPNRPRVEPSAPTASEAANRRVEILVIQEGGKSFTDILKGFEG